MDPEEYDRMIESGHRPGVQVVGYAILFGLIGVCGIISYFTIALFNNT